MDVFASVFFILAYLFRGITFAPNLDGYAQSVLHNLARWGIMPMNFAGSKSANAMMHSAVIHFGCIAPENRDVT